MRTTSPRRAGAGVGSRRSRSRSLLAAAILAVVLVCSAGLLALTAPTASAHVVPTSTVQLDVDEGRIEALVSIPVSDLEAASGLDLEDGTPAAVDAAGDEIRAYLQEHVAPTSDDGLPWTVDVGTPTVS